MTIVGSKLSDDNVETESGDTQFTTITGHVSDVATIHASRFVSLDDSELIDDLVDIDEGVVTGTTVHIEGHNVGSVVAGGDVTLTGRSALVTDIVQMDQANDGTAVMVDI